MFIRKIEDGYVVEMSAVEHEKAMTYGTEEYRALREIRSDYPGIEVMPVKTMKPTKVKDKLNMKTIKAYVLKHGTDEQIEHFAFISKRTIDEDGEYCEAQPFFQIKAWFLAEFPEIKQGRKDYREAVQKIYDAAAEKAAA